MSWSIIGSSGTVRAMSESGIELRAILAVSGALSPNVRMTRKRLPCFKTEFPRAIDTTDHVEFESFDICLRINYHINLWSIRLIHPLWARSRDEKAEASNKDR